MNGKSELYKAQTWWKDSWSVVDDIAKPYDDEIIIANNVAGSLSSQIPADVANYITSLTVSGDLNGTDIKQIRSMLQNGFLTTLDIENVTIVAGGEAYGSYYSREFYTQNDSIGENMFEDSPYLETIKLPSNLEAIGEYAFYNCKNLRSLSIPEGIKVMEYQIIGNCGKLEELSIPSTIQVIDDYALNGCGSLGTIYCSVMEIGKIKESIYGDAGQLKTFDNIADDCTWHVVNGKSELYKAQTWWKDSWTVVDDIANVEEPEPEPKPELEKITLKLASDFQTYCSDKDLDFTNVKGLKAYIASGFNPDSCEVLLSHVNLVPAKTGMLLIGTAGQDYEVPYAETDFIYSNLFRGKLEDDEVTSGYVLDGKEFVAVDGSVTVKGGEAYLNVAPVANAPRLKLRFAVTMDMSDAAGIDDILLDAAATSGAWYTLQGVRLNGKPSKPGVYVHQGRKVVVK